MLAVAHHISLLHIAGQLGSFVTQTQVLLLLVLHVQQPLLDLGGNLVLGTSPEPLLELMERLGADR